MEIKVNDVFHFQYKPEVEKNLFSPYHCFDAQLIAKQKEDGTIYLEDTYWSSNNKTFSVKEVKGKGDLTFRFNMDDVEPMKPHEAVYFSDEDYFDFSYQHGSYKRFVKKKNAERSKEKMLQSIKEKIDNANYELERAQRNLKHYSELEAKVESGDLNVYI